ncbi:MAG: helix-hairpin-helix domain-containing protein [Dehalococcoidales bacterium]|nr:helix-hairpin-helix domain-containing protein [Dehalococcoidales bacterium]
MKTEKPDKLWLLATFLLIFIIILSAFLIRNGNDRGRPIEFVTAQNDDFKGNIHIEGAVNNPGIYRIKEGETLESVIQAAGGVKSTADMSRISLYVPGLEESAKSQLIDLNRAEVWLLRALPDIGDVKAQAIIEYRREHGFFKDKHEITRVPGIGESTYEKIKDLITITP